MFGKQLIIRHLFIIAMIVCFGAFCGISQVAALTGDLHMHDPSCIRVGNAYYGFSTGFEGGPGNGSVTIRKTTDTTMYSGWTYVGTVWSSCPSWITSRLGKTPPNFWAPDINYFNGKYYLYYGASIWGTSTATMGLLTATNIEGPWTDQGEVTNVNYPIDPNVVWDGSTGYITWGSWTGGGIYMRQLDSTTGKLSTTNTTMTQVATGVENVSIMKNGSYFYMFGSKGTCCSGINSTYYTVLARATSVRGPYTDENGTSMTNGGGTRITASSGNEIGPGGADWFDDGGVMRLCSHFYNKASSGAETLNIRTISFAGNWLYLSEPVGSTITWFKIINRTSGKCLDTLGGLSDGSLVGQKTSSTSFNQQWKNVPFGTNYIIVNRATGKCLDSLGATTDGAIMGIWYPTYNNKQVWSIYALGGGYYRATNQASVKALDNLGSTVDGAYVGQKPSGTGYNLQWQFVAQ
jgi:arabinan endo-1,5-alpha-L-arabinosidase